MAILIIAGITVPVAEDGLVRNVSEFVGSSNRVFNGNLRSTKRTKKRNWTIKTQVLLTAEAENIENAVELGQQVTCTGDVLGSAGAGAGVVCEVEVGDSPAQNGLSSDGVGFFRILNLHLREV
jgi:hypothetical protein